MTNVFYTFYYSPIGILKITASQQVIHEIVFVNAAAYTEPGYELTPILQQCVDQLIEYFNGHRQQFNVPVYQQGTLFQSRVWSELLNICYGKTITYLDLAKRLGDAKAIRAAASTNGKNQLCIVVPCHRVVGINQKLVGYAGGLPRKKWLLNHENKIAHGVQTLF